MDYSGQRFSQYQIIEKLGHGGMAAVYRAYDTRLERDVAVKVVRKESIPPEQLERILKRFEREARALAKFLHPNIVPLYDYGEYKGAPYLVMAYLSAGTLKERIGKPVAIQTALGCAATVAGALDYAHQRGIVHRDIKPSNILITEEETLMLSDFGIAQVLEEATTQLTMTGLGVGTPEYMAPEQWQGQATAASDQYALGVVLYELLTGKKPYSADTPLAIALKVMSDSFPRPSLIVGDIPAGVEKLLYKALARDPEDRYEDMGIMRRALEAQLAKDAPTFEKLAKVLPSDSPVVEPTPVPRAYSESETVDLLEVTPVESVKRSMISVEKPPARTSNTKKKPIPSWAPWAVGGGLFFLGLVILLLGAILLIGNGGNQQPGHSDFLSAANTAVELPLPQSTATLTAESALGIGSTMLNPVDGSEMVYVPAGEFLMGNDDGDAYYAEGPQHTVYLDAYWIYQYEVTNSEYRHCVEEGSCSKPRDTFYYQDLTYDDHPVVYVSWYDAQAYCEWAGGCLPTEAEWEKAARGTDARKYPWGNRSPNCSLANYYGCTGDTAPVGSYSNGASYYGAMDLAGNVWEWVADWYDQDYYSHSPRENPEGSESGNYRVTRGCSWSNYLQRLRVSFRGRLNPYHMNYNIGFRCLVLP